MVNIPKTASKPKITDQANGKFPNITDGTGGTTNFFTPNYSSNPLAVGMYPP